MTGGLRKRRGLSLGLVVAGDRKSPSRLRASPSKLRASRASGSGREHSTGHFSWNEGRIWGAEHEVK